MKLLSLYSVNLIVIEPPSTGFAGVIATVSGDACTPPLSAASTGVGITATTIIARISEVNRGLPIFTRR